MYYGYILLAIIPVIIDSYDMRQIDPSYTWDPSVFIRAHSLFLSPFITLLPIPAFIAQLRQILSTSDRGALSMTFLMAQSMVFTVLAKTWCPGRLVLNSANPPFWDWYRLVGFVPVDHGVIAFGQSLLLLVSLWRHNRRARDAYNEKEPLLPSTSTQAYCLGSKS